MNIYVGNLSYNTGEDELREAFEQFGAVDKATVIMDRETGKSRGFGFVEMSDSADGQAAIDEMDGADLDGRSLRVNEARPREDNRGGGRSGRNNYR